jgi:hypothetical protein
VGGSLTVNHDRLSGGGKRAIDFLIVLPSPGNVAASLRANVRS